MLELEFTAVKVHPSSRSSIPPAFRMRPFCACNIESFDEDAPAQFHAILADSGIYAHLVQLHLNICFYKGDGRPVDIPFSVLTRLRDITIHTNNIRIGTLPTDGPCLPALRSLTFASCRMLERDWITILLRRLKDQGNIPELAAAYCYWDDTIVPGS